MNAQKYYFYCSGLPKSNNSALQKPLQSLVAIHRLTCKKILRIDLSKLNCILHQVILLTVMHFQCNTQVQISCMNPCKLLRSLYALISHQSNGDCPFFFFFLKNGVLGIRKIKKKKRASTLAEKIVSAKQRAGKSEKTHNSK